MTVHQLPATSRCSHVDEDGEQCITRLCYLNPGPECYIHAAARRAATRPARPVEVERIMRQAGDRERISA